MTTRITQDHPPRLPAPHEYARHLDRVATKPAKQPRYLTQFLVCCALGALMGAAFAYYF